LPSYVVLAETVNCFKTRLDRFWLNQDIIYNFRSEIHGTGSRIFIKAGIVVVLLSQEEAIPCACFLSTSTSMTVAFGNNWTNAVGSMAY